MKKDADAVIIIFLNIFKEKIIIIVYFGRLRINDFYKSKIIIIMLNKFYLNFKVHFNIYI